MMFFRHVWTEVPIQIRVQDDSVSALSPIPQVLEYTAHYHSLERKNKAVIASWL